MLFWRCCHQNSVSSSGSNCRCSVNVGRLKTFCPLYVTPDTLSDDEVRALWGPCRRSQDSLFFCRELLMTLAVWLGLLSCCTLNLEPIRRLPGLWGKHSCSTVFLHTCLKRLHCTAHSYSVYNSICQQQRQQQVHQTVCGEPLLFQRETWHYQNMTIRSYLGNKK